MKQIASFEEYRDSISSAKKNGMPLTNCYFLPAAAKERISAGKLFLCPLEEGLLLLEDEGSFYRCYYFFGKSAHFLPLDLDKDAVIEFPFQNGLTEKQTTEVEKFQQLGFHLGRESAQMKLDFSNVPPMYRARESTAEFAEKGDNHEIRLLLDAYFDKLYSFLPTETELDAAIAAGRVFVIRSGGKIAAVLNSEIINQQAVVAQCVVEEGHRGKGFAQSLLVEFYKH